jgi:hypothetical protein
MIHLVVIKLIELALEVVPSLLSKKSKDSVPSEHTSVVQQTFTVLPLSKSKKIAPKPKSKPRKRKKKH